MPFPHLLSSLHLGSKTVRNRIVSTAHGEQWSGDGLLNERLITYYDRRARGGVGLMITFGSAPVYKDAATANTVSLWDPRNEPHLREMSTRVHAHGALLMAQATHRGTRERPRGIDDPLQAPSPLPGSSKYAYLGAPHVLDQGEIADIVKAYGAAAAMLERGGFDGIELTALGTHLMEQFWSPRLNTRTDQYGGSFANRMRFSLEVLQSVADAVSPEFLIAFRISGDPGTDLLGLGEDDMVTIARRLDEVGRINFFDVSGGSGVNVETHAAVVPNDTYAAATFNHLARRMKRALSVPVLVAGRILTPADGEAALAAGDCDLVGMTRAMIADPDMPTKAQDNAADRIRPCIAINEGCRRVTLGMTLACSVNPAVADASLGLFVPSQEPRSISVVGGGPAGLEAARVAAERGHHVTLLERSDRLGGQMHSYASVVGHPNLLRHVAWLERELDRLRVDVRLGRDVSAEHLLELNTDDIVLATGAQSPIPPEGRGVETPVYTDVDVASGTATLAPQADVMVYDFEGRLSGASIAARLAASGTRRVELVFPHEAPCEILEPPNKPAMFRRLAATGVVCRPHHFLTEPRDGRICFRDSWSDTVLPAPSGTVVVFAGYREARCDLQRTLRDLRPGITVRLIGDCRAPRLLRNAVSEGARAGIAL